MLPSYGIHLKFVNYLQVSGKDPDSGGGSGSGITWKSVSGSGSGLHYPWTKNTGTNPNGCRLRYLRMKIVTSCPPLPPPDSAWEAWDGLAAKPFANTILTTADSPSATPSSGLKGTLRPEMLQLLPVYVLLFISISTIVLERKYLLPPDPINHRKFWSKKGNNLFLSFLAKFCYFL